MKAVQIATFGKPLDVARCVDVADVGPPGSNEVVIAVEASPINQYDFLMIAGDYGYRPTLPVIAGSEGAGRVVAVGAGVRHLKEGDRTLVPFLHPTWAERIKTDVPWLRPLPPGDVNQFAMMGVNPPTAYLLLTDIAKLPRGSWVIQNGAVSAVGRAVIAIAKSLGLMTVNVVRRDGVIAEIKALGGDVVLLDGPDLATRVAVDTGNAPIILALDGIADTSPTNLMSCLSESGVLVSYGGTSRKPMVVQPGNLIFKKQTILRSRRYVASGFYTGISRPSRMKSRRCSTISRRWSPLARSRPQSLRPTVLNKSRKRSRKRPRAAAR
jgi:NADPH:quinone reductase-like Zn-dependent oxidoreductase